MVIDNNVGVVAQLKTLITRIISSKTYILFKIYCHLVYFIPPTNPDTITTHFYIL